MSDLLEIRTRLVKQSGHFELVADAASGDYSDNGANIYINDGQRWLDDQLPYAKGEAILFKTIVSGESFKTFSLARIVKSVWCVDAADGRTRLERKTFEEMQELYPDVPLTSIDTGRPVYFCNAPIGVAPELIGVGEEEMTGDGIIDLEHTSFEWEDQLPLKGIIVMPPADGDYTLKIICQWYCPELTSDEDVSFWSVERPQMLVRAARMKMEMDLHRNSTGKADFQRDLLEDLQKIYHNLIAEEMAGPPSMHVMKG